MCRECVSEIFPKRGTMCMDEGQFLLNLRSCATCGYRGPLREAARTETTSDDECEAIDGDVVSGEDVETTETVEFDHVCPKCQHVVGHHFYRSVCNSRTRRFLMECTLCGQGADESEQPYWKMKEMERLNAGGGEASSEVEASTTTTVVVGTAELQSMMADSALLQKTRAASRGNTSMGDGDDDEDDSAWDEEEGE